jgi:hypothetical protein
MARQRSHSIEFKRLRLAPPNRKRRVLGALSFHPTTLGLWACLKDCVIKMQPRQYVGGFFICEMGKMHAKIATVRNA